MSSAIDSSHNGVLTLREGAGTARGARERHGDGSHEGVAEEGTEHPWDPMELPGPSAAAPTPRLCRAGPDPRSVRSARVTH